MALRNLHLADDSVPAELRASMDDLRAQVGVPGDFGADVLAAAEAAAADPRLPDEDRTELPFVTIDPPGSMDLDQAMHLARDGDGYVVHYAIADVAAFVSPGDPIDVEARRRGETYYAPDQRVPLHPTRLSEDAASLLPGQVRPAFLWTIGLDGSGATTSVDVRRARVRSTARLDYAGVQQQLDNADPGGTPALLRTIGDLLLAREAARGGVELAVPEQEVVTGNRAWTLEYRGELPTEKWNAQISLLTGMAAGRLMLDGRVGLLRTLPAPDDGTLRRLRQTARALGVPWPDRPPYADAIRSLDASDPRQAAMLTACTALFRGAGYTAFNGAVPQQPEHAAIGAAYAHTTAPLRRLADRWALEISAGLCARTAVPEWVLQSLDDVPPIMADSGRRTHSYERGIVDLVEAGVLRERVGEDFDATVVDVRHDEPTRGTVMLTEPAVEASVTGPAPLPLGDRVTVRLDEADVAKRQVRFSLAPAFPSAVGCTDPRTG